VQALPRLATEGGGLDMDADDQLLSPSATLPHTLLDALNNVDDDLMEPPPGLCAEPTGCDVAGSDSSGLAGEWSWKTSAKDFVPGTLGDAGAALSSSGSTFGGSHSHSGLTRSPVVGPSTNASSAGSPALGPAAWNGASKTGWTGMNPDALTPMAVETDALGSPIAMEGLDPAEALAMEGMALEEEDMAEFYVQQQLWCMQQVKDHMEAEWQKERKAMIDQIARFRAVLTRYSIPLEEVDAKMEQLLKEMPAEEEAPPSFMSAKDVWETQAWRSGSGSATGSGSNPRRGSGASGSTDMPLDEPLRRPPGLEEIDEGDVASTLKAMFPHAKVRTGSEESADAEVSVSNDVDQEDSLADPEVLSRVEALQKSTSSALDDRAQKSLGSLEAAKAMEVLQKVEELVEAQGGECRNLSSMLQSVCRKMERKMLSDAKAKTLEVNPGMDQAAFVRPTAEESKEYWTVKRIEKAAERAFETWYEGDRWRLKFSMAGLDPSLSDIAMERCMAWLRRRLAEFKDASGPKVLRQCRAEVDFSQNDMSDRALWMLLDCLTQFEVQASYLKLNNNRISGAGMLALCEFIRNNKRAGQIYELHLSQNEIDDASALELFRTLKELKHRYPPKREIHGYEGLHLVPLWLRLSRNKIRDPAALLETLTAEEITFCPALRRDGCGPGYCSWEDTPLVHLPFFSEQVAEEEGEHDAAYPAEEAYDRDADAREHRDRPRRRGGRNRNRWKGTGEAAED